MTVTNDDNNECGDHCPFLNRADRRCSDFFHLDRLEHAFAYCFGGYRACPVYADLLAERRAWRSRDHRANDHAEPLVQVTVSVGRGVRFALGAKIAKAA
jgi:hypothetical protein